MTEHTNHTESGSVPGCIMCAVRTLTEGTPRVWTPGTPGQSVNGAVLAHGTTDTNFSPVPYVDLWLGGTARIRVILFGFSLQQGVKDAQAQIGDRLEIRFNGMKMVESVRLPSRPYRDFSVGVTRGHH